MTRTAAACGTILYSGSLAQPTRNGGLSWFHLQFVLGFRRLGWDVLFLDRLAPGMCRDRAGAQPCPVERSANLRYFLDVMDRFGVGPASYSLAVQDGGGNEVGRVGLPRDRVLDRARRSAALVNAMGFCDDPDVLAAVPRRAFLDMDPGFGQMWRALGLHDPFAGHDAFVTLGRNVGRPGCPIPTGGLPWVTMPQPVVLEHWPAAPPPPADTRAAFTSIGAWRGPNGPVEYEGVTYGLRCHEFRRFADLPRRRPATRFELALDIHAGDARDVELLTGNGWQLSDPAAVAGDPWRYRDYMAGSRAEFMVPKHMYVAADSGLLSDRSAYYLATGRPVLARDTGIRHLYPTGKGLVTFATPDEAADGVDEINGDYAAHCRAAREIAVEHFDSDRVLSRLLTDLGLT